MTATWTPSTATTGGVRWNGKPVLGNAEVDVGWSELASFELQARIHHTVALDGSLDPWKFMRTEGDLGALCLVSRRSSMDASFDQWRGSVGFCALACGESSQIARRAFDPHFVYNLSDYSCVGLSALNKVTRENTNLLVRMQEGPSHGEAFHSFSFFGLTNLPSLRMEHRRSPEGVDSTLPESSDRFARSPTSVAIVTANFWCVSWINPPAGRFVPAYAYVTCLFILSIVDDAGKGSNAHANRRRWMRPAEDEREEEAAIPLELRAIV